MRARARIRSPRNLPFVLTRPRPLPAPASPSVFYSRSAVSVSKTLHPISAFTTVEAALKDSKFPTNAKWLRAQRYIVEVIPIGPARKSYSAAFYFDRVQYKRRVSGERDGRRERGWRGRGGRWKNSPVLSFELSPRS